MGNAAHKAGLRSVALFEAFKGVLMLLVGCGLLTLLHKDLDTFADHLTDLLRLGPHSRLANLFYSLADHADDFGLWKLAALAMAYSAIRFIEAVGLWRERAWAEWFALVSGCTYLPLEINGVMHHPRPLKWAVLLINVAIVLYMAKLRMRAGLHRT